MKTKVCIAELDLVPLLISINDVFRLSSNRLKYPNMVKVVGSAILPARRGEHVS